MKEKLNYLRYPFLKAEIEKMGYELESGTVLKNGLVLYLGTALAAYFYQLQLPFLIFLAVLSTLAVPYRIFCTYRSQYEKKKYLDLTIYIEQMLYSFRRHPKILEALRDTGTVFADSRMEELIRQAVHRIQDGSSRQLYQEALAGIEAEYGCQRLRTVHDFMIKVEERGGGYQKTADLLLEDRERWKTNTELLDKEKKNKLRAINIVLIATLIICGVMTSIFGVMDGINVTDHLLYQVSSTAFAAGSLLIWLLSADKLGGSWEFKESRADEEKINQEYELIVTYDGRKARKKARRMALVPGLFTLAGVFLKSIPVILLGVYFSYFILTSPKSRIRNAKKKVSREIRKLFPQWLMELTLLLQTENVYVSLTYSMQKAPLILQREIQKLLSGIDQAPNSIEPYNAFFHDLHMEEVATCMKILYSVSSFDALQEGDSNSPVLNLVHRNTVMMNKAEQMAGEEKLAVWTAMAYLPMAIGGIKIILDMVILIISLITAVTAF